MLQIKNITWTYSKFENLTVLKDLLTNRMAALKIVTNLKKTPENDGLIFLNAKDDRLCISAVEHKIPKSDGKDLKSKRLSKKQYEGFFGIITNTLDELGLSADVHLMDEKTGMTHHLRQGKESFDYNIPKQKSFPVEKE